MALDGNIGHRVGQFSLPSQPFPVPQFVGLSPTPFLSQTGSQAPRGWSRPDWEGQPSGHSKGLLGGGQVAMLRRAGASGVRRWAPGRFLTASQMADSGPLSPELPASRCLCRLGPRGAHRLSAAPRGPPGDAWPSLQRGRRRPAGRRPPGQWRLWLGSDPPRILGCCSRWWATARPWPSLWLWSTTTPPRSSRSRYRSLWPPTLARRRSCLEVQPRLSPSRFQRQPLSRASLASGGSDGTRVPQAGCAVGRLSCPLSGVDYMN